MKVSLLVGGVERNFTEEELIAILENHFGNADIKVNIKITKKGNIIFTN